MIESTSVTPKNIKDVITTSQKITSINYESIVEAHSNPNYLFQFRNRSISVSIFFTKIHEQYYNEQMFVLLFKLLEQKNYPKSIFNVVKS